MIMMIMMHMGPELQNSFIEVTRGNQYGKLTIRHHVFRKYVSPNFDLLKFWFLDRVVGNPPKYFETP